MTDGVPLGHWTEGPFCVFDVETTGTDVAEDRIIQASFVVLSPSNEVGPGSYTTLVDPGDRPVCDGALETHGITAERVRAEGGPPDVVLAELTRRFRRARARDYPIVIYNLPFDWSIYLAECARHAVDVPDPAPYFLDPLLLDRVVDKYRRGKRTLSSAVAHYLGREIDGAHDAQTDAVETGRVLREMLRRYPRIGKMSLADLQDRQREWYEAWRTKFNAHQAGPKGHGYVNDTRWPV